MLIFEGFCRGFPIPLTMLVISVQHVVDEGLRCDRKGGANLLSLRKASPWRALPQNGDLSPAFDRPEWQSERPVNADIDYSPLIAQDHAQEAIVNRQCAVARVIDKA